MVVKADPEGVVFGKTRIAVAEVDSYPPKRVPGGVQRTLVQGERQSLQRDGDCTDGVGSLDLLGLRLEPGEISVRVPGLETADPVVQKALDLPMNGVRCDARVGEGPVGAACGSCQQQEATERRPQLRACG
jgi:hypothetical protein